MDGIEILKVTEVYMKPHWVVALLAFAIILFLVAFFESLASSCNSTGEYIALGVIFVFLIGAIITFIYVPKQYQHTLYDIRVDDSVTFSELYEKYEVMNKKEYTNVYTAKERITE